MLILLRSLLDAAFQQIADSVSTSTVETGLATFNDSISDSVATATTENYLTTEISDSISESASATASELGTNSISASLDETNSANATESANFITSAADSNTTATNDSVSGTNLAVVSLTETSVSSTETETNTVVFLGQVTDSVAASETQTYPAFTTYNETVSETTETASSESSNPIIVVGYDEIALGVSELSSSFAVEVASSSDTITSSDSQSVVWIASSTVTDTNASTSTESSGLITSTTYTDTTSTASSESNSVLFVATISESNSASATESATATLVSSVQETNATLSNEIASNDVSRSISDTVATSTTESAANILTQDYSDITSASETISTEVSYGVSSVENNSINDNVSSTTDFLVVLQDIGVSTSSSQLSTQIFGAELSDTNSANETVIETVISRIFDSISVTDICNTISIYNDSVSDFNSTSDSSSIYVTRLKKPTHERSLGGTIPKSSTVNVSVFLRSSIDHLTAVEGLVPVIKISKSGSAFVSVNRTIVDIGEGLYNIALTSNDTDTVGELLILVSDPLTLADSSLLVISISSGEALTKGEFLALS